MPGEERDPQRFWLTVPGELRQASARSALIQAVMVAPDLHAWTIVERLPKHMPSPQDRLWQVDDDVPELGRGITAAAPRERPAQPRSRSEPGSEAAVAAVTHPHCTARYHQNIGPDRTRCRTTNLPS